MIGVLVIFGIVSLFFLLPAEEKPAEPQASTVSVPQPATNTAKITSAAPDQAKAAERGHDGAWLYAVALVSAVTALIAVLVAFYLYRWRRIFIAGHPNVLVPEDWVSAIRGTGKETAQLRDEVQQRFHSIGNFLAESATRLEERSRSQSEEIRKLAESLLTLQNALDERDQEIARLKKGFDNHVYRKFLTRFIRVHQALLETRQAPDITSVDIKELDFIEALLVDALEESEVTTFEPEIGADVRALGDRVSDALDVIPTDDPQRDYRIVEVVAAGYETYGSEEALVILPAKVRIYRARQGKIQESAEQGA